MVILVDEDVSNKKVGKPSQNDLRMDWLLGILVGPPKIEMSTLHLMFWRDIE